jgi:hypothetical protein
MANFWLIPKNQTKQKKAPINRYMPVINWGKQKKQLGSPLREQSIT